jgi:hypothetical protein
LVQKLKHVAIVNKRIFLTSKVVSAEEKKYSWFYSGLPSALFGNLKNKDEMSHFLCDGRQVTWKQV